MQVSDPTTKLGKGFAWIAWLLLLAFTYMLFDQWLGQRQNPNQQLQSVTGEQGERVVILQANNSGHYVGTLLLNQQAVDFMLDTGATTVAVSEQVAQRTGMTKGTRYQTATANGLTYAYQSRIAELQLGAIVLHDLPAAIVPNLAGAEILLGMSALKHLEFTKQANQLKLIQR